MLRVHLSETSRESQGCVDADEEDKTPYVEMLRNGGERIVLLTGLNWGGTLTLQTSDDARLQEVSRGVGVLRA